MGRRASRRAFGGARALAAAVGHAVPLRRDADPGRALRRDGVARAGRHLLLRRRRPRRHLPAGRRSSPTTARCSGAAATTSSRRRSPTRSPAARRRAATAPRSRVELADGLPRILAAAHERLEARAGRRPPRRRRPRRRRRRRARRARSPRCCARSPARAPTVVLHTDAAGRTRSSRAFTRSREPLDRRGEHGQRGRRHPAPARRRLRDGGQDAADLPPDRRPLRAHDPGPRAGAELALPARPTPCCARHAADVERELRHVLRPPAEDDDGLLDELAGPARDRAVRGAGLRPARRRRRAADGAVRRRPAAPRRRRRPPPRASARRRLAARRCRRSSAARCCATSATASSPTSAGATAAATPRSTRGSTAQTGIARVDDASIDQLERSIELLLGALSGRR